MSLYRNIFLTSYEEPLTKKSQNLHESFLTLCKSNFVKTMAAWVEGAIIGETVFNCAYIGKIFVSPPTISCEKDISLFCACIIASVMAY
jgi:hypothetical protein